MKILHLFVRAAAAAALLAAIAGCCVYPPYGRGRGYYGGDYRSQERGTQRYDRDGDPRYEGRERAR